jgi:hypothetical protein
VHEATGTAMGVSEMGKCIKQTVGPGHGTKRRRGSYSYVPQNLRPSRVWWNASGGSEELTVAGPNVVFFSSVV